MGALYRGLTPSLLGAIPYVGIDFAGARTRALPTPARPFSVVLRFDPLSNEPIRRTAVYDTLRAYVPRQPGTDDPSVLGKLAAGAFAGACGQTAAYPLDTVRRILQVVNERSIHSRIERIPVSRSNRMMASSPARALQVQDVKVKHGGVRYAGMVDALGGVVRRDGVRALYAGLGVNILKVVPSVSISFVVFEAARDRLAATL